MIALNFALSSVLNVSLLFASTLAYVRLSTFSKDCSVQSTFCAPMVRRFCFISNILCLHLICELTLHVEFQGKLQRIKVVPTTD